ncbi:MAG: hypothetical protein Q9198_003203, partial [Flavoplaca austrocitrina]
MKSYPEIEKAAAKVEKRLRDAGPGELTAMVVKFYTLSRIAAENAKEDIDWLQNVFKDIDKRGKTFREIVEMKCSHKNILHGSIIGDIAEALAEYGDEVAAVNGYEDNEEDEDY